MAIKKSVFKVDNGSGFDEVYFKTSSDQVECNKSLTDGQGYVELPGGIVIQWMTTSELQMLKDNRLGGGGLTILPKEVNNILSIERYITEINGTTPKAEDIKHFAIECTAEQSSEATRPFVTLGFKWTKNEQLSETIKFKCKVVVVGIKND